MNEERRPSGNGWARTIEKCDVADICATRNLVARACVPLLLAGCLLFAASAIAQQRRIVDGARQPGSSTVAAAGKDKKGQPDKRRGNFVVTGKVTDPDGQPIDGVTVSAGTGWNTLTGGGQARTGFDGRYTLTFGPGIVNVDAPTRVAYQAAAITASKSGYVERNMSRHGDWRMSSHPEDADRSEKGTTHTVVLPEQPRELDFVLVPAASIRGRMVDAHGQPVTGLNVSVTGKQLPPASGVYATTTTDDKGRFSFEKIPTFQPMWFHMFAKADAKHDKGMTLQTSPSDFSEPRQYDVELLYDTDARKLTVGRVEASGTETAKP